MCATSVAVNIGRISFLKPTTAFGLETPPDFFTPGFGFFTYASPASLKSFQIFDQIVPVRLRNLSALGHDSLLDEFHYSIQTEVRRPFFSQDCRPVENVIVHGTVAPEAIPIQ